MPSRSRALDECHRWWRRTELEIGDQLRTARHVLGLTEKQVAAAVGVSQSEVSR
nr:helix-turn-helix transcriptional regulator [Chloroflexota bacterium]